MSKSQSVLKKHSNQQSLSNAKRTELIFNAYVLSHSQQSYSDPFQPELLIKCLENIEAQISGLYPEGELGGNHD